MEPTEQICRDCTRDGKRLPCPDSRHVRTTSQHCAPKARRSSAPQGLTLVETLVTLAFLGVLTVGMAGLVVAIVNGNAKSRAMDIATYLTNDRLETIRNTPYANITAANFPAQGYGTITVGNPSVAFPDFQRVVTIQDNTPAAGMKRAVVTVSWPTGSVSGEMVVAQ